MNHGCGFSVECVVNSVMSTQGDLSHFVIDLFHLISFDKLHRCGKYQDALQLTFAQIDLHILICFFYVSFTMSIFLN